MGGYGSGRWGAHGKPDARMLVESCYTLDINRLVREGSVRPEQWLRGRLFWTRDGKELMNVVFEADTKATAGTIRLIHTGGRAEARESLDYRVPLVTTPLVSGGRRWWFRCMASRNGGPPCGRRAAKLYLPRGGKVFACRRCYGLAYTSSRESRKWDAMAKLLAAETGFSVEGVKRFLKEDRHQH